MDTPQDQDKLKKTDVRIEGTIANNKKNWMK